MSAESQREDQLPANVRRLFWDCDPSAVDLEEHRSFVIRRVLEAGGWEAITWLRQRVGDETIRDWLVRRSGRGLDPRRLRFWALILDLPDEQVDPWVQRARAEKWFGRRAG